MNAWSLSGFNQVDSLGGVTCVILNVKSRILYCKFSGKGMVQFGVFAHLERKGPIQSRVSSILSSPFFHWHDCTLLYGNCTSKKKKKKRKAWMYETGWILSCRKNWAPQVSFSQLRLLLHSSNILNFLLNNSKWIERCLMLGLSDANKR